MTQKNEYTLHWIAFTFLRSFLFTYIRMNCGCVQVARNGRILKSCRSNIRHDKLLLIFYRFLQRNAFLLFFVLMLIHLQIQVKWHFEKKKKQNWQTKIKAKLIYSIIFSWSSILTRFSQHWGYFLVLSGRFFHPSGTGDEPHVAKSKMKSSLHVNRMHLFGG